MQKRVIEFAKSLELGFDGLVVVEPANNVGFAAGVDGKLLGLAAGIADGKDQDGMATALGTLETTAFVADGALEQRAAKDLIKRREIGEETGVFSAGVLLFHQI